MKHEAIADEVRRLSDLVAAGDTLILASRDSIQRLAKLNLDVVVLWKLTNAAVSQFSVYRQRRDYLSSLLSLLKDGRLQGDTRT